MQNEKRLGADRKQGAPNTVIEPVTVSILKKGDPRLVASLLKVMRKKTPVQRKNENSGACAMVGVLSLCASAQARLVGKLANICAGLHIPMNPAADSERTRESGRLPVGISGRLGSGYAPPALQSR